MYVCMYVVHMYVYRKNLELSLCLSVCHRRCWAKLPRVKI